MKPNLAKSGQMSPTNILLLAAILFNLLALLGGCGPAGLAANILYKLPYDAIFCGGSNGSSSSGSGDCAKRP